MSKWTDILLKNDKEFSTTLELKKEENNDTLLIEEDDINIKDVNDEFYIEYMDKFIEIKIEFENYIKSKCLPFLNKKEYMENPNDINITINNKTYTLYDYIKYNSINYIELSEIINKQNNDYLKEIEQENENTEFSD